MAQNTSKALRSAMIYSIYVRNYGPNGSFKDVEADLDRIKRLGTDIIWLLPIHPIGQENRKGSLGSPYSIQDYRAVNPEYGTLEDFEGLIAATHAKGMKLMIDVVYNHTSWDSVLMRQHPEYFYRDENGNFGNRAGVWSDVVDLDYANSALWDYQIETLQYWAGLGVDGFRCDVASVVPVAFWEEARRRVEETKPGMIWLAESVHSTFLERQRLNGFECWSDAELYSAFDITYDYDIHAYYEGLFHGGNATSDYLREMRRQQSAYPANFLKLRFLENHDQPRAMALLGSKQRLFMWSAFQYFARGVGLVYAGQEAYDANLPSLFERDAVDWSGLDGEYGALLGRMRMLRSLPIFTQGAYELQTAAGYSGVAVASYSRKDGSGLMGVFNLDGESGEVQIALADGIYRNLLDDTEVPVRAGKLQLQNTALILEK